MPLTTRLAALATVTVVAVPVPPPVVPVDPSPGYASSAAAASSPRTAWQWPLAPEPAVVRPFDPPDVPWGRGHRGVDLAASVGQAVRSPADGRVGWVGVLAGRGVVVVVHPGGLRSTFEPVTAAVGVGTPVGAGEPVGTVTATPGHCAPATCLHWGVLRGATGRRYVDPLSLLGRGPVVLLPLS